MSLNSFTYRFFNPNTIQEKSEEKIEQELFKVMREYGIVYDEDLENYELTEDVNKFKEGKNLVFDRIVDSLKYNFPNLFEIFIFGLVKVYVHFNSSDSKESEDSKESSDSLEWLEDIIVENYMTSENCSFSGLSWTGNSCYLDSVLLALFAVPNKVIDENILEKKVEESYNCSRHSKEKIQEELKNIAEFMRGNEKDKSCINLREMIRECPGTERFESTNTQDAGEFLNYIFTIFDVNVGKLKEIVNITNTNTNDVYKIKETVTKTFPIVNIYHSSFKDGKRYLNSYLTQHEELLFENMREFEGIEYDKRVTSYIFEDYNYLIFSVHRTYYTDSGKEKKSVKRIIPPERIGNIALHAIVVHLKNHYTCYIKCNDTWFYYDDLKEEIDSVGDYDDMIQSKPDPKRNGVLFFYNEV